MTIVAVVANALLTYGILILCLVFAVRCVLSPSKGRRPAVSPSALSLGTKGGTNGRVNGGAPQPAHRALRLDPSVSTIPIHVGALAYV